MDGYRPIEVNVKKENFLIKSKDVERKSFAWKQLRSIPNAWFMVKEEARKS